MSTERNLAGKPDDSRCLLITGAAGFIGAGLARALASSPHTPLLLLDQSEQGLIELDRSLVAHTAKYRLLLANVADRAAMRSLLRRYQPGGIIHAAAYKNVVMLERQIEATLLNNAIATFELVHEARLAGVGQFLLVSTDKAVEPHSILGASKRAAELLALSLDAPGFRVNAIRLGNVLGSTGSVLPTFEQQLRDRAPLTLTHPDASRWFFTLDETVAFIREALKAQVNGRVLIPPRSAPLRIVDLARSLSPQAEITFIGLRPGEKLTESFVASDEAIEKQLQCGLAVVDGRTLSAEKSAESVARLRAALEQGDCSALLEGLRELVPEYVPSQAVLDETQ
ncbi:MAG TPA: polysaccharide biosynthesis protein [Bryobacteraceae bacterium]|nr:polysaccharide biosynthesis protein [Bryobacteraceae bacterium]